MDKTQFNTLQNFEVNIKIKLASLWASLTLCYLYCDYFELYVPHKTAELVSGSNLLDSPTKLFLASFLLAIPCSMVSLSILLKPSLNRWLNIIFGIFFTIFLMLIAITSLTPWRYFYVFFAAIESVISSTIVYYAWNWTKK
jgi:hypothetical protein